MHHMSVVCSCAPPNTDKKCLFLHVACDPSKNEKCWGRHPHLTDIGPPCAPWCAQHRLEVHNAGRWCTTLYSLGGAQCRSHKPRHTDTQTLPKNLVMWSITS